MGLYDRDYMRAPRTGSAGHDPLLSVRLGIRSRTEPSATRPGPSRAGRSGSIWATLLGIVLALVVLAAMLIGGFLVLRLVWSLLLTLAGNVMSQGGSQLLLAAIGGALGSALIGLAGPRAINSLICAGCSLISVLGTWGVLLRARGIDIVSVIAQHDLSGPTGGGITVLDGLAGVTPWWMLIVLTVAGGLLAAIADPEPAWGVRLLGITTLLISSGHLVLKGLLELGLL